jgi:hypothetical protein
MMGRSGREEVVRGDDDGVASRDLLSDKSRSGARGMKTAEDFWLTSPNHAKYKFLNLPSLLLAMCKGQ